jgi:hypothetical protein
MRKKLQFFNLSIFLLLLVACSDDVTSIYSNREYVYCYFNTAQCPELFNVMADFGRYITIREHSAKGVITMTNGSTSTDLPINALNKHFGFGLGGLIVGRNNYGEARCYDLACPICDRADRRLTIKDNIYATCSKCGFIFNLNNDGAIDPSTPKSDVSTVRGLYRYYIEPFEFNVNIRNRP